MGKLHGSVSKHPDAFQLFYSTKSVGDGNIRVPATTNWAYPVNDSDVNIVIQPNKWLVLSREKNKQGEWVKHFYPISVYQTTGIVAEGHFAAGSGPIRRNQDPMVDLLAALSQ